MRLTIQKRLAASVLGCSKKRIRFDPERLSEIKESITKADIKTLIGNEAIMVKPARGISRSRARKIRRQKIKGKQRGQGSRKGKKFARNPRKLLWIQKVRTQRSFLKELRSKQLITTEVYRQLYAKIKGGFFRSRNHLKLYVQEHGLFTPSKTA